MRQIDLPPEKRAICQGCTLPKKFADLQAENKRLKKVYEKAKTEIKELAMAAEDTTEEGYARAEGIINWLELSLKVTQ